MGSIPSRVTPNNFKNGTCTLSSLVLNVNGWVQESSSHAGLALAAHHQCSIPCESNHMAHGSSVDGHMAHGASGDGHRRPLVTFRKECNKQV